MAKETKKVGVRLVFAWIFSILFILSGFGLLFDSTFSGILMLIAGILILPPFGKMLKEKANLEISTWLKIIIVLILLVLAGTFMSSDSNNSNLGNTQEGTNTIPSNSGSSETQKTSYNLGERFEWGDYAYTFHSVDTKSEIGSYVFDSFFGEKADGVFLIFDVTIENIGKESEYYFFDLTQVVDDQDRIFDNDGTAEIYLDEGEGFGFEQLQPGLPKRGKVVFDVPQNINGKIRVSKGIFSSKYVYVSWKSD